VEEEVFWEKVSYLMSSGVLGTTARKAHSKNDAAFRNNSMAFLLLSEEDKNVHVRNLDQLFQRSVAQKVKIGCKAKHVPSVTLGL
jgi:hypothetical protein